jgi:hypothetical protein
VRPPTPEEPDTLRASSGQGVQGTSDILFILPPGQDLRPFPFHHLLYLLRPGAQCTHPVLLQGEAAIFLPRECRPCEFVTRVWRLRSLLPSPAGASSPNPSSSFQRGNATSTACKPTLGAGRAFLSVLCFERLVDTPDSPFPFSHLLEPLPRGQRWLPLPPVFLVVHKVSWILMQPRPEEGRQEKRGRKGSSPGT